MASDFSSSGSDWARQILQPPQSSWPTNTSIGFPDWACAMRANDEAAAIPRPTAITDLLFSIELSPVEPLYGPTMRNPAVPVKPRARGFTGL